MAAALVIAACASQSTPGAPTPLAQTAVALHDEEGTPADHNSAAHDDHDYINGWYEGRTVELFYTKTYFCQEPPDSAAPSGCELGEDALTPPRPGPIPTIYAIAAAGGIVVDPLTLSCSPASPCMNHPAMLDASRVLGPGAKSIGPVPHSHIVTEKRGGWYHTVNIRVRDVSRWNQIAAAKSLDKVRELQADGSGLVSPDTATNIYFFIASWRDKE